MTSAAPWAAIPQAGALAIAADEKLEKAGEKAGDYRRAHQSTTSSSIDDLEIEGEEKAVTDLARQITLQSIKTPAGDYVNPFLGTDDPQLDPRSAKFSPQAWTKTLVGIQSRDPERYPTRVAGVSYRGLNVHGFGTPTDYQKTFGNYPLAIASIFNKLTGRGKTKIQILRDFDGLVKSGEMLVVLGRPGSGCSTLLKTIAGETHGFFVDSESEINYQGQ